MEQGLYIVTSDCDLASSRAEFIDWYTNVHIPDVLTVTGFKQGSLYESIEGTEPGFAAVYDLAAASVDDAMAELRAVAPGFRERGRVSEHFVRRWGRPFVLRATRTSRESPGA